VHIVDAQTKLISGKVIDSSCLPLTGTTTLIKGTKSATVTDGNGN
jgi:ferric enterobactin receptor